MGGSGGGGWTQWNESLSFARSILLVPAWAFEGVGEIADILKAGRGGGPARIRTPFSARLENAPTYYTDPEDEDADDAPERMHQDNRPAADAEAAAPHTPPTPPRKSQQKRSRVARTRPLSERVMSAMMNDPITAIYDAFEYISADANFYDDYEDDGYGRGDESRAGYSPDDETHFRPAKKGGSGSRRPAGTGEQCKNKGGGPGKKGTGNKRQTTASASAAAVSSSLPMWSDVCMMHAGGAISMGLVLLPSIFAPSMLVSNCAMPGLARASAWPVLNSCFLLLGMSWTFCCMVHFVLGLPMLALCTSMHSVPSIMLAYAGAVVSCPLPPVHMPYAVSSGIGLLAGAMLLCVSHMHASSESFGTEDFYMCHSWAMFASLFLMRQTVFRAGVWMVARSQCCCCWDEQVQGERDGCGCGPGHCGYDERDTR